MNMKGALANSPPIAAGLAGCVGMDVGPINELTTTVGPPSPRVHPRSGRRRLDGRGTGLFGRRHPRDRLCLWRAARTRRHGDRRKAGQAHARRRYPHDFRRLRRFGRGRLFRLSRQGRLSRPSRALPDPGCRGLHEDLDTSPVNLIRAYYGGVNDRSSFARWLDKNLFDSATFSSFKWKNAPIVWINSSDINNRTPFLFTYDTFAALCSNLDHVRLSDAVAASAAVPVVFTPVVVEATSPNCGYPAARVAAARS